MHHNSWVLFTYSKTVNVIYCISIVFHLQPEMGDSNLLNIVFKLKILDHIAGSDKELDNLFNIIAASQELEGN